MSKKKHTVKTEVVGGPEEKSNTIVAPCSCKNKFQDGMYGSGRRVFNKNQRDPKKNEFRCTVCGTLRVF